MPYIRAFKRTLTTRSRVVHPLPNVPEPIPAESMAAVSEDMSLVELRALATQAGLPSYGTKADLVERITNG